MKIEEKISLTPGKRLSRILKDAKMSQRDLAKMASYTEPYISKIVNDQKKMSLDKAQFFADMICQKTNGEINVSTEYLAGLTESETKYAALENYLDIESIADNALETLLNFFGFGLKLGFWNNFDKLTPEQKKEYYELKSQTSSDSIEVTHFCRQAGLSKILVFEVPGGEVFFIEEGDYLSLLYELKSYIKYKVGYELKFRDQMKQMKIPRDKSTMWHYSSTTFDKFKSVKNDLRTFSSSLDCDPNDLQ